MGLEPAVVPRLGRHTDDLGVVGQATHRQFGEGGEQIPSSEVPGGAEDKERTGVIVGERAGRVDAGGDEPDVAESLRMVPEKAPVPGSISSWSRPNGPARPQRDSNRAWASSRRPVGQVVDQPEAAQQEGTLVAGKAARRIIGSEKAGAADCAGPRRGRCVATRGVLNFEDGGTGHGRVVEGPARRSAGATSRQPAIRSKPATAAGRAAGRRMPDDLSP